MRRPRGSQHYRTTDATHLARHITTTMQRAHRLAHTLCVRITEGKMPGCRLHTRGPKGHDAVRRTTHSQPGVHHALHGITQRACSAHSLGLHEFPPAEKRLCALAEAANSYFCCVLSTIRTWPAPQTLCFGDGGWLPRVACKSEEALCCLTIVPPTQRTQWSAWVPER